MLEMNISKNSFKVVITKSSLHMKSMTISFTPLYFAPRLLLSDSHYVEAVLNIFVCFEGNGDWVSSLGDLEGKGRK